MRLYEYEGKALLARHGLEVPRGALWPELPDVPGPLVVKAQIPGGKRGKQGGIRFAADGEGCRREAEALLGSRLGDQLVERVYVEERLEIDRELYLALLVDRDRRALLLLATGSGGVEVEEVPERELIQLPIDPLLGLRSFHLRHVAVRLGLSGDLARRFVVAAEGVYSALTTAEAELVEINPLAITRDGRIVAADAKVVLDDGALFRHREWQGRPRGGTPFEQGCAALGAAGVEMAGQVAIVVSGAGLMMATVDLLGAAGVPLRTAVDLGGVAFAEPDRLARLVRLVIDLNPRVIFVNGFMNLAYCDDLARGIAAGFDGQGYGGSVVVRLKGQRQAEAQTVLGPHAFILEPELPVAIQCVIAAARGEDPWPY